MRVLSLGFILVSPLLFAQTNGCSSRQSDEFNFWIGTWKVTANGQLAGYNRIEPILDGCVLQENWTGAAGGSGSSLNFYNPALRKWEQFWVWKNGTTIHTQGNLVDGKMVLSGQHKNPQGAMIHSRITWSANADGSVRQLWEQSTDGGKNWNTAFDGHYTKIDKIP